MVPKQGLLTKTLDVGEDSIRLEAGAYDLVALSRSGKHCARRVVLLAAGDFTQVYNARGVNRGPWVGLPANFVHECHTSYIETTQPIIVYF